MDGAKGTGGDGARRRGLLRRAISKDPVRLLAGLAVLLGVSALAFLVFVPVVEIDDPVSLVLLDRDGELLGATISSDEQWRFPRTEYVPERLETAILQFEDRRFHRHPGVDPLAVARAAVTNLRAKEVVSGASTITMQVVRLARKDRPRTWGEKLVEALLASRLEIALDKDEILELYVSHAPYGGNVVGIEAAAWRYLGRSHAHLSWADAAFLAVLPNSPGLIHPGRNRELLRARRDRLLESLAEDGLIDEETLELSKLEKIPAAPRPLPRLAPHLVARFDRSTLRREGASRRVTTTISAPLQSRATEVASRHRRRLSSNRVHNAAAVILEVETGEIIAYVGNAADPARPEHSPSVDCALARRSTGSTLKPLLYAGMLQSGEILPSSLVADVPIRIGGFAPENFDRTYSGAVPASTALARSLNVPAVRLLSDFGVARFAALLRDVGMTTLDEPASHYGLSLVIGGSEATLLELTSIYAGLGRAARGMGSESFFPAVIERSGGDDEPGSYEDALFSADDGALDGAKAPRSAGAGRHPHQPAASTRRGDHAPTGSGRIDAGAAYLTLQAMLEVERPGADAAWRRFASARSIAWKTGTSWGHRDAWAIGVSPRFAVGVWAGNAGGAGRPGMTGHAAAAPLLMELFDLLPPDIDEPATPRDRLTHVEVCAHSGLRRGPHCARSREERVPRAGLRAPVCTYCRIIHCDAECEHRVHTGCESPNAIRTELRFVLPPSMEWFYARSNPSYTPLPPWREDCREEGAGTGPPPLSMVHPRPGGRILIPRNLDGERSKAVFTAAHRETEAAIHWHLGDRYLGTTRDPHQLELAPGAGRHTLTLVDESGESIRHPFTVIE